MDVASAGGSRVSGASAAVSSRQGARRLVPLAGGQRLLLSGRPSRRRAQRIVAALRLTPVAAAQAAPYAASVEATPPNPYSAPRPATGNCSVNVVPCPSVDSTSIVPPWPITISRAMNNPSPSPPLWIPAA
ncbi:MAG: hypothetical protein QOF73_3130 [Thermomicrobiales bacterium]|nr:hypothetical protein [Thermomicrobiales bacterium]